MLPSLEEDPGINSALTEICQVLRIGFEDKIAQASYESLKSFMPSILCLASCSTLFLTYFWVFEVEEALWHPSRSGNSII